MVRAPAAPARRAFPAILQALAVLATLGGQTALNLAIELSDNGVLEKFDVKIRQIHVKDIDLVDRCESCHLGTREPVSISKVPAMPPIIQMRRARNDELRIAHASAALLHCDAVQAGGAIKADEFDKAQHRDDLMARIEQAGFGSAAP